MALTPEPEEVVSRVVAAVGSTWPDSDGEEAALLDRLLVYDVANGEELEPGYRIAPFRSRGWAETPGTVSTWRGRLLGLGWFLYGEPGSGDSRATEGYVALRGLLTKELGCPAEEWGPVEEPAVCWQRDGKSVEMYCHQRRSSVVQFNVGHQARSSEFETKTRSTRPF